MILRAGLLAGLAAIAVPAAAQDAPTECAADIAVHEDADWWNADNFSVRWTHWFPDRATFAVSAFTYDAHYRHHLEAEGPFSQWSANSVIVSPRTMRTHGKLWAQLSAQGRSLPPGEVSRSGGFYGVAIFEAHVVKDFIADAPDLTITFYDRTRSVVDRYTIPRAVIDAGTARMMTVYKDHAAIRDKPAAPCPPDIVLVH